MGPLGPFVAQIWPLAAQRPQIYAIRCAPAGYLVAVSVPFDSVPLLWACFEPFWPILSHFERRWPVLTHFDHTLTPLWVILCHFDPF